MATKFLIPAGFPAKLIESIPGATVDNGQLVFNCDEKTARKAIADAIEGKKFIEVEAKAYTPTEGDMTIVKGIFGNPDYDVTKLGFRKLDTCNTLKDRHDDILEKSFLDELAALVNKESRILLMSHDSRKMAGRKFRAEVVAATFPDGRTGHKLVEYVYYHKDYKTEGDISLHDHLESGTIRDVSIGFMGTGRRYDEKKEARIWFHEPGATMTENIETSFVDLGAQYFSNVAKSASNFELVNPKTSIRMEKVTLKIGEVTKEFTTNPEIQTAFDAMEAAKKTAETERDAAKAEVEGLKAEHINTVIARQKDLKSEIYTEDVLKSLPLATVKKLAEEHEARWKAANPDLNDPSLKKVTGGAPKKSPMDVFKEINAKK
jgi:hypothetical protein